MNILDFPVEILFHILNSLTARDLKAASHTSEKLRAVSCYVSKSVFTECFGGEINDLTPSALASIVSAAEQQGFPPNKDQDNTALALWTCRHNHPRLMSTLVNGPYRFDEHAALRLALAVGHTECVKSLLKRFPHQAFSERIDPLSASSLLLPVLRDSVELLSLLLERSVKPDYDGLLLIAARMGREKTTEWLIQKGANPNTRRVQVCAGDISLITPLSESAQQNHTEIVRILLRSGATPQPTAPTVPFQCALHWAIRNKNLEMTEALLNAGAELEAKDADGCTSLMLAASVFPTAALLLVQRGASITARDSHSNNLLHFAASSDESGPLVQEIAKRRDDFLTLMRMKNTTGNTPLMVASLHSTRKAARVMLREAYRLPDSSTASAATPPVPHSTKHLRSTSGEHLSVGKKRVRSE